MEKRPWTSKRKWLLAGLAAGALGIGFGFALTDVRYAPGVAIRDAQCDGAPCSIQAFRGPKGRLPLRLDGTASAVDFESRGANEAWAWALPPVGVGAIYRSEAIGQDRTIARTK